MSRPNRECVCVPCAMAIQSGLSQSPGAAISTSFYMKWNTRPAAAPPPPLDG